MTECVIGARHGADIDNMKKEQADQWTAIGDTRKGLAEARDKFEEALREVGSRLPNWAAVTMMIGSGVGGAIIGVLGTLIAIKG